ncbi:hypothetical protein [Pseudofrankia sp. BMG5.37]|uniref:hypothetical protein n=1 Tax=Pseudofrankia sp. BMG5.37 TaxID=3050035 RepID=UPI00289384BA|nr:hypothetical protein [Pseudofrankia sp. BMG5.37]MDT3440628.1 hypothetical protein [Pseudofrankia sp. BMG5.37]
MGGRPVDWSRLHLDGDPTPGDPDALVGVADFMWKMRWQATTVHDQLTSVVASTGDGAFVGKTADYLRDTVNGAIRNFIGGVHSAFEQAEPAVRGYIRAMRDAQGRADAAHAQAEGLAPDDPALAGLRTDATNAQADLGRAASAATETIRQAARAIVSPKTGCEQFWDAFSEVAIVVTLVAIVVGGPLGLLAFALNAVLAVKAVVDYSTGKTDGWGLLFGLLMAVAPTTKPLMALKTWKALGEGALGLLKGAGKVAITAWDFSRVMTLSIVMGRAWDVVAVLGKAADASRVLALRGFITLVQLPKTLMALHPWQALTAMHPWQSLKAGFGNQFLHGKWLRIFTPLEANEIGVYGLRGAFKLSVLGRGLRIPEYLNPAHYVVDGIAGGAHVAGGLGGHPPSGVYSPSTGLLPFGGHPLFGGHGPVGLSGAGGMDHGLFLPGSHAFGSTSPFGSTGLLGSTSPLGSGGLFGASGHGLNFEPGLSGLLEPAGASAAYSTSASGLILPHAGMAGGFMGLVDQAGVPMVAGAGGLAAAGVLPAHAGALSAFVPAHMARATGMVDLLGSTRVAGHLGDSLAGFRPIEQRAILTGDVPVAVTRGGGDRIAFTFTDAEPATSAAHTAATDSRLSAPGSTAHAEPPRSSPVDTAASRPPAATAPGPRGSAVSREITMDGAEVRIGPAGTRDVQGRPGAHGGTAPAGELDRAHGDPAAAGTASAPSPGTPTAEHALADHGLTERGLAEPAARAPGGSLDEAGTAGSAGASHRVDSASAGRGEAGLDAAARRPETAGAAAQPRGAETAATTGASDLVGVPVRPEFRASSGADLPEQSMTAANTTAADGWHPRPQQQHRAAPAAGDGGHGEAADAAAAHRRAAAQVTQAHTAFDTALVTGAHDPDALLDALVGRRAAEARLAQAESDLTALGRGAGAGAGTGDDVARALTATDPPRAHAAAHADPPPARAAAHAEPHASAGDEPRTPAGDGQAGTHGGAEHQAAPGAPKGDQPAASAGGGGAKPPGGPPRSVHPASPDPSDGVPGGGGAAQPRRLAVSVSADRSATFEVTLHADGTARVAGHPRPWAVTHNANGTLTLTEGPNRMILGADGALVRADLRHTLANGDAIGGTRIRADGSTAWFHPDGRPITSDLRYTAHPDGGFHLTRPDGTRLDLAADGTLTGAHLTHAAPDGTPLGHVTVAPDGTAAWHHVDGHVTGDLRLATGPRGRFHLVFADGVQAPVPLPTFSHDLPRPYISPKGHWTNGRYTISAAKMAPHMAGSAGAELKSTFLYHIEAEKITLDAAAYADAAGLWVGNKARVFIDNGPVGVRGQTGELTSWIQVTRHGQTLHSWPSRPPLALAASPVTWAGVEARFLADGRHLTVTATDQGRLARIIDPEAREVYRGTFEELDRGGTRVTALTADDLADVTGFEDVVLLDAPGARIADFREFDPAGNLTHSGTFLQDTGHHLYAHLTVDHVAGTATIRYANGAVEEGLAHAAAERGGTITRADGAEYRYAADGTVAHPPPMPADAAHPAAGADSAGPAHPGGEDLGPRQQPLQQHQASADGTSQPGDGGPAGGHVPAEGHGPSGGHVPSEGHVSSEGHVPASRDGRAPDPGVGEPIPRGHADLGLPPDDFAIVRDHDGYRVTDISGGPHDGDYRVHGLDGGLARERVSWLSRRGSPDGTWFDIDHQAGRWTRLDSHGDQLVGEGGRAAYGSQGFVDRGRQGELILRGDGDADRTLFYVRAALPDRWEGEVAHSRWLELFGERGGRLGDVSGRPHWLEWERAGDLQRIPQERLPGAERRLDELLRGGDLRQIRESMRPEDFVRPGGLARPGELYYGELGGRLVDRGMRVDSNIDGMWSDVGGLGRKVRSYVETHDGGIVRADSGPRDHWYTRRHWFWTRYQDGIEVMDGRRYWSWGGWADRHADSGAFAQRYFGWANSPRNAFHYLEHDLTIDHSVYSMARDHRVGDAYTQYSARGSMTERLEEVAGGRELGIRHVAEWRPPGRAGTTPEQLERQADRLVARATGGIRHEAVDFPNATWLRGDGSLQVFRWTERPAGGEALASGVRVVGPDGSFSDFAGGYLVRATLRLDDGHLLEIGRGADGRWASVLDGRTGDGGRAPLRWRELDGETEVATGQRHFADDGRHWVDTATEPGPGGERTVVVRHTSGDGGDVVTYAHGDRPRYEPPSTGTHTGPHPQDPHAVSVTRDPMGQVIARTDHWAVDDGLSMVRGHGEPRQGDWMWEADGATGPRVSGRGERWTGAWDESYRDYVAGADGELRLVRDLRSLEDGSTLRAYRDADGAWRSARFGADGVAEPGRVATRQWRRADDGLAPGDRWAADAPPGRAAADWRDVVPTEDGLLVVRESADGRILEYSWHEREKLDDLLNPGARRAVERGLPRPVDAPSGWGEWREHDLGTVLRERRETEPGVFRETEHGHGQWRETDPDGRLLRYRSMSGRIWDRDPFGRSRIVGREPGPSGPSGGLPGRGPSPGGPGRGQLLATDGLMGEFIPASTRVERMQAARDWAHEFFPRLEAMRGDAGAVQLDALFDLRDGLFDLRDALLRRRAAALGHPRAPHLDPAARPEPLRHLAPEPATHGSTPGQPHAPASAGGHGSGPVQAHSQTSSGSHGSTSTHAPASGAGHPPTSAHPSAPGGAHGSAPSGAHPSVPGGAHGSASVPGHATASASAHGSTGSAAAGASHAPRGPQREFGDGHIREHPNPSGPPTPRYHDGNGRPIDGVDVTRAGDRYRVTDTTGGPHHGDVRVYDRGGQPLSERVSWLDRRGRPDGTRFEIDHAAGTWRRVDEHGVRLSGPSGKVAYGAEGVVARGRAGELVLAGADGTTFYIRATLPADRGLGNRYLELFAERGGHIGDVSGRLHWLQWDRLGKGLLGDLAGRGLRRFDEIDGMWWDINVFGRKEREYLHMSDGGIVRADRHPGEGWRWHRYDSTGNEVLTGRRVRHWHGRMGDWVDQYHPTGGTERVAQQYRYFMHRTRDAFHYVEYHLDDAGHLRDEFTQFSPQSKETASLERLANGNGLQLTRFTEQRPPHQLWKTPEGLDGRGSRFVSRLARFGHYGAVDFPNAGFLRGDSRFQVYRWTERLPGGDPLVVDERAASGARTVRPDGSFSDYTVDGYLVRGTLKLDNGHTVEIGRRADGTWDSVSGGVPGEGGRTLSWRQLDGNRNVVATGERHFAERGHHWVDTMTEHAPGGDRTVVVRHTAADNGDVVTYAPGGRPVHDPSRLVDGRPLPRDPDAVSVTHNTMGQVVARSDTWPGSGGRAVVAGHGDPLRPDWAWEHADGTAGLRVSGRAERWTGAWDDSYRDFVAGADGKLQLVRDLRSLDKGTTLRAHRDDAGGWHSARYDADGVEDATSAATREFRPRGSSDPSGRWSAEAPAGRAAADWRDVDANGQVLRESAGGRVREYLTPRPPDMPSGWGQWREFDLGGVFRQRLEVANRPGIFRETENFHHQWRETDAGGKLLRHRTLSGRIYERDALGRHRITGGERTEIVGREIDFRGATNEFRGVNRYLREANRRQFVATDGLAGEFIPVSRRVWTKLTLDWAQEFTIDLTARTLSQEIYFQATEHRDMTLAEFLRGGVLGAGINSVLKGGVTALHEPGPLKGYRDGLANVDGGKHYTRNPYNQDKNWSNEWAGNENPPRWRTITYDYTTSTLLASPAISFLANTGVALVTSNGDLGKSLREGGAYALSSLAVGGTIGSVRTGAHAYSSGRFFHRGGLADIGFILGERTFERLAGRYLYDQYFDPARHAAPTPAPTPTPTPTSSPMPTPTSSPAPPPTPSPTPTASATSGPSTPPTPTPTPTSPSTPTPTSSPSQTGPAPTPSGASPAPPGRPHPVIRPIAADSEDPHVEAALALLV